MCLDAHDVVRLCSYHHFYVSGCSRSVQICINVTILICLDAQDVFTVGKGHHLHVSGRSRGGQIVYLSSCSCVRMFRTCSKCVTVVIFIGPGCSKASILDRSGSKRLAGAVREQRRRNANAVIPMCFQPNRSYPLSARRVTILTGPPSA